MRMMWLWVSLGLTVLALVVVAFWFVGRAAAAGSVQEARTLFAVQRAALERSYFDAAAASGKPRGLRWKALEWSPGVEFARERETGQLAALVAVTIQFEAVPGSDMEGLPAVGNLRNASAVFFYHQRRWHTTGKTIFNLNPDEALARFKNQYDRLGDGKPPAADSQ
jgi:hypothetical protein